VTPDVTVPALEDRRGRRVVALFRRFGFRCLVWSLVGVVLVPLVWPVMVTLNETTLAELVDKGLIWWLGDLRGTGFVLYTLTLVRGLQNSLVVATATGVVSALFAACAAYSISRFDFAGRRAVAGALLVFPAVPQTIVAMPLYFFFLDTPLYDTLAGLVIAYVAMTLPFTTWLLIPYFARFPDWMEDAALVDGASRVGAFARVVLPNAKPGLAAAFVLAWMLAYNEFTFAVMLIDSAAKQTFPLIVTEETPAAPVTIAASLPMVVIFAVLWYSFLQEEVRRWVG
jgi:multiple sugar transport system permease protein